jgi:hypothetical protein
MLRYIVWDDGDATRLCHDNFPSEYRATAPLLAADSLYTATQITAATGNVTLGDAAHGCAPSTFTHAVSLGSKKAGVSVQEGVFEGALKATGDRGDATVIQTKSLGR